MLITNIFNILDWCNKVHESYIGYYKEIWCGLPSDVHIIIVVLSSLLDHAVLSVLQFSSHLHIWSFLIKIKHHERKKCLTFLSSAPKEVPDGVCTQNNVEWINELEQWFSNCGPGPTASYSLGNLFKMKHTQTLGIWSSDCVLTSPASVSDACLSLRTRRICFVWWISRFT